MRFLCQNDFGITKSLDPTATLSVHLHSRTLVTLIPVMLRFVWPFNRNTDIICLFSGKLGEFGVPSSLHFDVFPVESFIQFSAFYNFNAATAAAIPLGLLTLMILIIERFFTKEDISVKVDQGTDDHRAPRKVNAIFLIRCDYSRIYPCDHPYRHPFHKVIFPPGIP